MFLRWWLLLEVSLRRLQWLEFHARSESEKFFLKHARPHAALWPPRASTDRGNHWPAFRCLATKLVIAETMPCPSLFSWYMSCLCVCVGHTSSSPRSHMVADSACVPTKPLERERNLLSCSTCLSLTSRCCLRPSLGACLT